MYKNIDFNECKTQFFLMAISFILFILTAFSITHISAVSIFDLNVIESVHSFASLYPADIAVFITNLGDRVAFALISIFVAAVLIKNRHYLSIAVVFLVMQSAIIATYLLKNLFERPRPPAEFHLVNPYSFSFPSGHTLLSTAFYGILIYLVFKFVKNNAIKYSLIAILTMLIIAIGFTRTYLGVHYPTDVFAGFFTGVFLVNFWVALYKIQKQNMTD